MDVYSSINFVWASISSTKFEVIRYLEVGISNVSETEEYSVTGYLTFTVANVTKNMIYTCFSYVNSSEIYVSGIYSVCPSSTTNTTTTHITTRSKLFRYI